MKHLLLLVLLLKSSGLWAQACQPIELFKEPDKRALLLSYIAECHQKHHFIEDKGVVQLVRYTDPDGLPRWYLSALIDDRYQATPPAQYAQLNNDMILVYEGDSSGQLLPVAGDAAGRRECIREVVGGRVYHYSDEPSYTYVTNEKGEKEKIRVRTMSNGNLHHELIIRFNKDGTVSKFTPV